MSIVVNVHKYRMNTEKVSSAESAEPWCSRRGVAAGGGGAPMLRNGSKASASNPAGPASVLPSSPHASAIRELNALFIF